MVAPDPGFLTFFATKPDFRQFVQTRIRIVCPPTIARTDCRFGAQIRLVTLWAWLMRWPNWMPLPQISHARDMMTSVTETRAQYIQPSRLRQAVKFVPSSLCGGRA